MIRRVPALIALPHAILGLIAAFALTVEKLTRAENSGQSAACDVNLLVQCSANLDSWQGSLFGFPNPLIGLMGWPVVISLLVLSLAQVSLPKWILKGLSVGMVGAYAFILWLMYVSFWQLGTLCPWCMATWFSTIVTSTIIWTQAADNGVWGAKLQRYGQTTFWAPTLIIIQLAIAAGVAQVQLDWLTYAFI
jgi:uncharacterized membrane protein